MAFNDGMDEKETSCFYVEPNHYLVCAVEMELPEKPSEVKRFNKDATAWVAQKLKKSPEVKMSQLNAEQRREMSKAKQTEINSWLQQEVVKKIEAKVDSSRVMRMRWVLTF